MFFLNCCNESAFREDPERGRSFVLSSPLCLRNCSSPASSFPFLEAPLSLEFASIRCETDNKRSAKLFSRQLLITRENKKKERTFLYLMAYSTPISLENERFAQQSVFRIHKKWLKGKEDRAA